MEDSPTPVELLLAIAQALSDEVVPATEGPTRHTVRVAANLCQIVAREIDPETTRAGSASQARTQLASSVGATGNLGSAELSRLLDAAISKGDPVFDAGVFDALFVEVCRRVDIAKPGYREHS